MQPALRKNETKRFPEYMGDSSEREKGFQKNGQ
jgi:hypothetical protein